MFVSVVKLYISSTFPLSNDTNEFVSLEYAEVLMHKSYYHGVVNVLIFENTMLSIKCSLKMLTS